MNIYIAKEGKFYTGWKVNTDFAFETKEDLHEHMEKVNGFKCNLVNDEYSKKNTRFTNKKEAYGYEIISLQVKGTPVEEPEVDEPIEVAKKVKKGGKSE